MQDMKILDLPAHDRAIDITAETCPMTFVRTRLALDSLPAGAVLLVRLKGDDPRANVPRAAADQGHDLLDMFDLDDGSAILVIRKAGA
ncbi:sulfurtransferase TusA family protein [Acidiphilium sp. PA]|uniref:sulfurtransferase TusA family protein n=1 Tax=Acidiphilium sp. PA TaxID=2871705 RepID=UPI0022449D62|nr:sulfurtransferase TusA family protein [Acidiphilium sp. PA]MCW8305416.1 sulfurtransferase TusA family protein [Acidiphilium sp. PA]